MERIFSHAYRDRRGLPAPADDSEESNKTHTLPSQSNSADDGLHKRNDLDTTLLLHLFGKEGDLEISFEEFAKFMQNLQTEVLELEFQEFSKGNISQAK